MNIILTCLIGALCGIFFVGVIFIVKFLYELSTSLRKLSLDQDYYMCKFLKRLRVMFIDDIEDED